MTDHDVPSEFTHPPTPPDEDPGTPCEQAGPAPDQEGPALRGPTGAPIPGEATVRAQQGPRLTTPQGAGVYDTDHSLKAGARGPLCSRTTTYGKRSPISITSGSPSGSFTPAAPAPTECSAPSVPLKK